MSFGNSSKYVEYFWENLVLKFVTLVFDSIIPAFQSLIPGSPNSAWNNFSFVFMMLAVGLVIVRVYLERFVYN